MPATSGASGPGRQKLRLWVVACWTRDGKSSAEIEEMFVHFASLHSVSQVSTFTGMWWKYHLQPGHDLPSSSSIPRHHVNTLYPLALGELPGERVLSPSVADEQDTQLPRGSHLASDTALSYWTNICGQNFCEVECSAKLHRHCSKSGFCRNALQLVGMQDFGELRPTQPRSVWRLQAADVLAARRIRHRLIDVRFPK